MSIIVLSRFVRFYLISAPHIFFIPPSYRRYLILLLCTSTNQPRDLSFVTDEGKKVSPKHLARVWPHTHTHTYTYTHTHTHNNTTHIKVSLGPPQHSHCIKTVIHLELTPLSLRHINIATHFSFANATHRCCALEGIKTLDVKIGPPSKMSDGVDTVTRATL